MQQLPSENFIPLPRIHYKPEIFYSVMMPITMFISNQNLHKSI